MMPTILPCRMEIAIDFDEKEESSFLLLKVVISQEATKLVKESHVKTSYGGRNVMRYFLREYYLKKEEKLKISSESVTFVMREKLSLSNYLSVQSFLHLLSKDSNLISYFSIISQFSLSSIISQSLLLDCISKTGQLIISSQNSQ